MTKLKKKSEEKIKVKNYFKLKLNDFNDLIKDSENLPEFQLIEREDFLSDDENYMILSSNDILEFEKLGYKSFEDFQFNPKNLNYILTQSNNPDAYTMYQIKNENGEIETGLEIRSKLPKNAIDLIKNN